MILILYSPFLSPDIFTTFLKFLLDVSLRRKTFHQYNNIFLFRFENSLLLQLSFDTLKHNNVYGSCVVAPVLISSQLGKP